MVTGPTSMGRKPNSFFSVINWRCNFQKWMKSSGLGRVS